MTTVNFSQSVNSAGVDTLSWGTALASLANTTSSLSGAVDNRPTLGSTVSFDLADLQLVFSSAFTPTSGGYLAVTVLCAVDGTNYASPTNQIYQTQTFALQPASSTVIELPNLIMRPFLTKFLLLNNSGSAFPSGTITASLMRRSVASF